MNTEVDIDAAVASRLRQERAARGWSMAELATRSGVSKAMIGKIERGQVSATAALLVRISAAFELTLAGFLTETDTAQARLSRAHAQPRWTDPGTGYVRRQISALPEHPVELTEVVLPPAKQVFFPVTTFARIRQSIWVLEGALTITEADVPTVLEQGDCLAFGPPCDVTLANQTERACRYLVCLSRQ